MSKQKTVEKSPTPRSATSSSSLVPTERAIRETVESVAIAFVLAFLFRTFEAEAFVIPTGSMAPTLQGMHKDLNCPECGYAYRAGASNDSPDEERQRRGGGKIVATACPMCSYKRKDAEHLTSYNGDRILVSKLAYDIGEPQRWDVFVFRYPGDAKINYIKRLVGLPNETLTIRHGDIFVRKKGEPGEQIARKPPDKVLAMLMDVHDNQYISQRLDEAGWPRRWFVSHPTEGGWVEKTETEAMQVRVHERGGTKRSKSVERMRQRFETSGAAETSWITYQHFLPEAADWERLDNLKQPRFNFRRDMIEGDGVLAYPHTINDDYAYNDSDSGGVRDVHRVAERKNWVGDLAVECEFHDIKKQGSVMLQLAEGGLGFECRFDLAEGTATLTYSDLEKEATKLPFDPAEKSTEPDVAPALRVAQTTLGKNASGKVLFANVDDQLLVWVDGELLKFDGPTTYSTPHNHIRNDADHLRPVRLGAQGATLRVDHLRVMRDVYYIATHNNMMIDQDNGVTFEIGADQFFAMGDNSPASQDSRIWNQLITDTPHTVDRRMLIGKALFIYWPHSLDYFPFCPNIPRMGFVR